MTPSGIAGRQNARNGGRVSTAIPRVSVSPCRAVPHKLSIELFAKRFKVTENGSPRTASGLEVIIIRLISKEIAGDRRATAVRLKYLAFAHRQKGAPDVVIEWGAK
jgi:hypothetical protein